MKSKLSVLVEKRPSPAMVVAVIALVVACAGTAVANRDLISSSEIRDGAIRARHLADSSITKVVNRTLDQLPNFAGPGGSAQVAVAFRGGGGTVISDPDGIACFTPDPPNQRGTCSANFPVGEPVTLIGSGSDFIAFSGACVSTIGPDPQTCTFTPGAGLSTVTLTFTD